MMFTVASAASPVRARRIRIRSIALSLAFSSLSLATARAQQPEIPAVPPPATAPATAFKSLANGISFVPPAGVKQVRTAVGSREFATFVDEGRKWTIRARRVILEPDKPIPLTTWKDKDGHDQPGMLEITTEQFKTDAPGAEILRQDTTNLGDATVGLLAARYSFGVETNLAQQAILRANDLQYYIIAMNSPAPRQGAVDEDPGVVAAVEAFTKMIDSIKLLDQSAVKEDQDQRLFRTRTFYVNLTETKMRDALQPQQWLRIMRDGKDVGYTYVVEEVSRDLPRKGKPESKGGAEGVLVGARSRLLPENGGQVDAESWAFCTFDRKYEAWSNVTYASDPKNGKTTSGELGVGRWRERPIPAPGGIGNAAPAQGARGNPSLTEEFRLEVTKIGRNVSSEPIVRSLPPFYIPQAVGQLLARLVPLREPKTFLFATWVSDAGQLMYRYVDVLAERDVTLGGKHFRAVPVQDRVGLEGSITTHYVSPEGKYLGSVNEDSGVTILPSDAKTLAKLWNNANLSRPGEVEEGK